MENIINITLFALATQTLNKLLDEVFSVSGTYFHNVIECIKEIFLGRINEIVIEYNCTMGKKGLINLDTQQKHNNDLFTAVSMFIFAQNINPKYTKCNMVYKGNNKINVVPTYVETITYKDFTIKFRSITSKTDKGTEINKSMSVLSRLPSEKIIQFLDKCYSEWYKIVHPDNDDVYLYKHYYNGDGLNFESYKLKNRTTFDSIFFSEKSTVMNLVQRLTNGEINKLGLLLYGLPGCGKTSIIKSIANMTSRHIVNIKLSNIKNDDDLFTIFNMEYFAGRTVPKNKRIYIFEDIDAECKVVYDRSKQLEIDKTTIDALKSSDDKFDFKKYLSDKTSKGITLAGILNVLDGIAEINDSIVIMTTNHIEKLDPALIRPGRITLKIHLTSMTSADASAMIKHKYNKQLDMTKHSITPAELESVMMQTDDFNQFKQLMDKRLSRK